MEGDEQELAGGVLHVDEAGEPGEPYRLARLMTRHGRVECRYYPAGGEAAVACVGGVGGGWDTPALGLYPRLAERLQGEGIATLRVRFRNPRALPDATHDLLAGLAYLRYRGHSRLALVGHSLGGAVVIRAAAAEATVRAVVTLATQSYGTEEIASLAGRCSLLMLHGTADPVLPPYASEQVYAQAADPKELIFYPEAGHLLDEAAEPLFKKVHEWLLEQLRSHG